MGWLRLGCLRQCQFLGVFAKRMRRIVVGLLPRIDLMLVCCLLQAPHMCVGIYVGDVFVWWIELYLRVASACMHTYIHAYTHTYIHTYKVSMSWVVGMSSECSFIALLQAIFIQENVLHMDCIYVIYESVIHAYILQARTALAARPQLSTLNQINVWYTFFHLICLSSIKFTARSRGDVAWNDYWNENQDQKRQNTKASLKKSHC